MNTDELAAIRRRLDAATPGPWRGTGDKVRATAADALIEDNILVAYYTGHDHRLGLKTTGVAADIDLIANAPADLAALLGDAEKLNEVREFHRSWGDQDTDTLDGLDLWEQLGRLLGVTPVSVHLIPEHGSAYFTCDFIGGKPEHRSACRAAITVRSDQGPLWLDPSTAELPVGWVRAGGGHLCQGHAHRVPKDGHVAALTFSGSAS